MVNRVTALEKRLNVSDKLNVFLCRWAGDNPVTRASYADMVFEIMPNETESLFQDRVIKETSVIPYTGATRTFYVWLR